MKISIAVLILFIFICVFDNLYGDDKEYGFTAYKIYDSDGDDVDFKAVLKKSLKSDIVFFGESHNNTIAHWLQLELAKAIFFNLDDDKSLVIGAEMFETDVQLIIDEYLSGKIPVKNFEQEAKVWSNYKTDYKPLMDFAFEKKIKYVATNIPRRYAARVNTGGLESLDALSDIAKSYIAPLPIEVDLEIACYKNMEKLMAHTPMAKNAVKSADSSKSETDTLKAKDMKENKLSMDSSANDSLSSQQSKKMPVHFDHGKMQKMSNNFKEAQAIKDATMAYFIGKNLPEKGIFLHLNGSYHSDYYEGIVWFIKRDIPKKKILTITIIEKKDIDEINEEERQKADFIIVVPETMTKSY